LCAAQTFACDDIPGTSESYRRADYSMQCCTAEHTAYRIFAGVMICVYPLGIPAAYVAILWSQRDEIARVPDVPEDTVDVPMLR
jgi:hypothetical protein